jgi:hypothetical protein
MLMPPIGVADQLMRDHHVRNLPVYLVEHAEGTRLGCHRGMQTASEPRRAPHAIGTLVVGGDWACAHGDLGGLADVARRLATLAGEPLRRELVALADACHRDPDQATAAWVRVKTGVLRSLR